MALPNGAGPDSRREGDTRGEQAHVKLGRYEIVRELGKGAMGIVYLAKDPVIGRLVALKTIRTGQTNDDDDAKEFQQRFVREAQAAGILNHPSIVTVHDIGADETTGTSFIAMEFVEGHNLREVLQQGRPLTFDQIGDIVAQIAEALDFAHQKGITHRDVKPANIIILEGLRAKITDFGIAKIASGGANLTSTGQFLGTPNYMAPEQIKGAPVDGRTDIFALGICLYECLTRRKPFGGDSLTAISYKIVHEAFPPVHEINPQIPAGYEEVIGKCLEKDPAKRFQRARELAAAIRSVIRGEKPDLESLPNEAEATMVTRDGERLPTMEYAQTPTVITGGGSSTGTNRAAGGPSPVVTQIRKTIDAVHSIPVLGMRIPALTFFAIVIVLAIGLALTVTLLKSSGKMTTGAQVDPAVERQHLAERDLRNQANALLRNGNTAQAYEKFQELNRMAPNSPAVIQVIQQLDAARASAEISRQQVTLARQKFDEGMAYYSEEDYEKAIPIFQEAFSINPGSDEIAKMLQSAKDNQARIQHDRSARGGKQAGEFDDSTFTDPGAPPAARPAMAGVPGPAPVAAAAATAQLNVTFESPWPDGTIVVNVGSQNLLNEPLFEERGKLMFRRKYPRNINTTKSFNPGAAVVDVQISAPSAGIQEHHVIPRVSFQPGSVHRLSIRFDPATRKFQYPFN